MGKTGWANLLTILKQFTFFGIQLPIYLFGFLIMVLGVITHSLPTDILGTTFLVFTCGLFLGKVGDSIPIWKDYFGGGAIFAFLVTSWLVYQKIIPQVYVTNISKLWSDDGLLDLYIAITITGSLLSIDRKFLFKAIGGFIPMVLIVTVTAMIGASISAVITGLPIKQTILNYALPIMGGGNGAGVIPLSQIWGKVNGQDPKIWYSSAVSTLTLANIVAIITAALLDGLGKKVSKWTGHGDLMKGSANTETNKKSAAKVTLEDGAAGVFVIFVFYALGNLFGNGFFPTIGGISIHPYAWMVIFLLIANGINVIPERVKSGAKQVNKFMTGNLFYILIAGVGISMVDFSELINAVNLTTLIIILFTIFGAVLGSWFFAKIVGFYEIDSAIAGALCHVNRGGSGDLEILGASKRMNLMPYAQVATRLGGAFILIIGSFLFTIWS